MRLIVISAAAIAALMCGTLRVMADGPSAADAEVVRPAPHWTAGNEGHQWDLDGRNVRIIRPIIGPAGEGGYILTCMGRVMHFADLAKAQEVGETCR